MRQPPGPCTQDSTQLIFGVSGIDGAECDVTIANGTQTAVYRFPATSDPEATKLPTVPSVTP